METITITHRLVKGKNIYNKRFDDYERGYYGPRISRAEYEDSKKAATVLSRESYSPLSIKERICYEN